MNDRGSQAPNLWGLCAEHLDVDVISMSRQQFSFSMTVNQKKIFTAAVYAATSHIMRRDLWNELQALIQGNHGPWLWIGDFNSILGAHEQRGGGSVSTQSCTEFRELSEGCALTHLPTLGSEFSWINNRSGSSLTERRLDGSLCNDGWLDFWCSTTCTSLTRINSDHHPLLINLKKTF